MSSTKADKVALQKANRPSITAKFPKAKLIAQFKAMAEATGSEAEATLAKQETAYVVCQLACTYRVDAYGVGKGQTNDVSTILDGWREHWKLLIAELHAIQSPFVELGEPNKAGEQRPVMTGYGRNVASQARGIIEFEVPVVDDAGEQRSSRDMSDDIKAGRKLALPQDRIDLNTARDQLTDSLATIRESLGTSIVAINAFDEVVVYCQSTIEEHSTDGLVAIGLVLDDVDLSEWLTIETEAETEDTEPEEETAPVQIAAA